MSEIRKIKAEAIKSLNPEQAQRFGLQHIMDVKRGEGGFANSHTIVAMPGAIKWNAVNAKDFLNFIEVSEGSTAVLAHAEHHGILLEQGRKFITGSLKEFDVSKQLNRVVLD